MTRRRVAIATSRALADLLEEDRALVPAFAARGIEAVPVVWDDPAVHWEEWPAVLVRSTWDYSKKAVELAGWLDLLERKGATVWNPVAVIRWNLDKHYLKTLRDLGVALPPSVWIEPGEPADLAEIARRPGWSGRAVVKPCIGAGAIGAFVTGGADTASRLEALRAGGRSVIVQDFVPEIASEGELSLNFIAGEFSHAVRKRPRPGDWRVQEEWGGSVEPVDPPREALVAARRLLEHAPGPLLYARVDGVMARAGFLLMELEIFEPQLFFDVRPEAADRLAAAFASSLDRPF